MLRLCTTSSITVWGGISVHHPFSAPSSKPRVAAIHCPASGAGKQLFLRQRTSSRHRADVRGDKCDTYPAINPVGLAPPPLCLQCLLLQLVARSRLVLLCEQWSMRPWRHSARDACSCQSTLARPSHVRLMFQQAIKLFSDCYCSGSELLWTPLVPVTISVLFVLPAVLPFSSNVFFL